MNSIVNWIWNFSLCSDCDSISFQFQWCVNWLGLCVKYGTKKERNQNVTPFQNNTKTDEREREKEKSWFPPAPRLAQESWVWWGDADWWDTALLQNKNLNNAHGSNFFCCCYWLWLPLPSLPFTFSILYAIYMKPVVYHTKPNPLWMMVFLFCSFLSRQ